MARRRTVRRLRDALDARPWVTAGLATLLGLVHLGAGWWDWRQGAVDGWGVVYGSRTKEAMIRFGGRAAERVADGELWRLVSCGFLHVGPVHLFLNGLALVGLGPLCEAIFGRERALGIFLAAVVGGATCSQLGGVPLAVGASGGVFGWMGALVAFGWTRRAALHARLRPMLGRRLWPWVLVNLAVGAFVPGVDNLGHVGGLVVGVALGAVSADRVVDHRGGTAGATRWISLASLGALAYGLGAMLIGLAA